MTNELKIKAIDWFVRMRDPDTTDPDAQEHAKWLSQNDEHRMTYQSLENEWRQLDALTPWAKTELRRLEEKERIRRKKRKLFWFTGFGVPALAAAIFFMIYPSFQTINSEHYATGKGEQRRVILEDGSRVHLNSASEVEVRFNNETREVYLQQGESLFDVAHEPGRPFVVHVQNSRIVAVGTRFNVYYESGTTTVTVLEGKVAILSEKEASSKAIASENLLLEPNRQARIDKKGLVGKFQTVDSEKLTAWDNGILIFDQTPLREVIKELARYVGGEIEVATSVPDYPVTGTFKIRDKETMLKVLSEVIPVTPVRASSTVTMLISSS